MTFISLYGLLYDYYYYFRMFWASLEFHINHKDSCEQRNISSHFRERDRAVMEEPVKCSGRHLCCVGWEGFSFQVFLKTKSGRERVWWCKCCSVPVVLLPCCCGVVFCFSCSIVGVFSVQTPLNRSWRPSGPFYQWLRSHSTTWEQLWCNISLILQMASNLPQALTWDQLI